MIFARGSGHAMNHELVRRLTELMREERDHKLRQAEPLLDIRQVQRILPHRYPLLMIDRVLELEGQRAVGIKNVTVNEQFFQGHFPGQPVMPGVLIVEAMAQLSGVLLLRKLEHTGKVAYLVSMDKVKIRRPVVPGDQLVIEVIADRVKSRTGHVTARATVASRLVAEAELTFMMADTEPM
jgi:beta-hydroxyacyl-ACP dehydratase FabZ